MKLLLPSQVLISGANAPKRACFQPEPIINACSYALMGGWKFSCQENIDLINSMTNLNKIVHLWVFTP